MAIIKAVNRNGSLAQILRYITNEHKTSQELIGGWNLDPARALEEMTATKKYWGKADGRIYKHFIQSFDNGAVSPEKASQIAWEFVQRVPLFQGHEVLFATHTDRDHIHTHFIVNSVSFENGKKLRYAAAELDEIKRISDQIILEQGLKIEKADRPTENVTAWDQNLYQILQQAHKGQKSSWMYDTAVSVLEAMEHSQDRTAFTAMLETAGYRLHWKRRNVTFEAPNGRKVRASRLEDIFKIPSVLERYGDRSALQEALKDDLITAGKLQKTSEEKRSSHSKAYADSPHPSVKHEQTWKGRCHAWKETASTKICVSTQKMENSAMQQEIDTAAYVYGNAMCRDQSSLEELLAQDGYQWDEAAQIITTPKGTRFRIASGEPATAEAVFSFQKHGELVHSSYKGESHTIAENPEQAVDTLLKDLAEGASMTNLLMDLTRNSWECEVDWSKPGTSRIHLQDGWYSLDSILKMSGLPFLDNMYPEQQRRQYGFPETISAADPPEQSTEQNRMSEALQMQELLTAVQKAAAVSDTRTAFTEAMNQAGYKLRWTKNGTLTFINPEGEHIRASRLEKKYRLPPIAAAYGQPVHSPTRGERPKAARAVQDAVLRSTTLSEFTVTLREYGYEIQWNSTKTDAVITTKGGGHIRLSSLERQFGLPSAGGIFGLQHKETGVSTGNTEQGLDALREAAARAAASLQSGRASLADRETGRTNSETGRREISSSAAAGARNSSVAAAAAMCERKNRDAGRERSRIRAEQEEQRRRTENAQACGRTNSRSTGYARSSPGRDMER